MKENMKGKKGRKDERKEERGKKGRKNIGKRNVDSQVARHAATYDVRRKNG